MRPQLPPGHVVKFHHGRKHVVTLSFKTDGGLRVDTSPYGGTTTAIIYDDDGQTVVVGVARCRSDEHFVKAIGRDVSLGRALKKLRQSPPNTNERT